MSNCTGYRRGKGIAYLTVCRGLFSRKMPVFRKTLNKGYHGNGQPWHTNEIFIRGRICYAHSINPQGGPGAFCAGRAQIRATMLF